MNGYFRSIDIGDISRDCMPSRIYFPQTWLKNNLSAKIFVCIILLNHHNNVQKGLLSNSVPDDVIKYDVIFMNHKVQFLELSFLSFDILLRCEPGLLHQYFLI